MVARYRRVAITRAWGILGDFHLAQDVAQDGFVIAFRKIDTLRDSAAFGPWLLEIVRREAIRHSRKIPPNEFTLPIETMEIDPMVSAHAVKNEDSDWQHKHARVVEAIGNLPVHEQEVVVLHYVDGMPTKQISEILSRPNGTITKQLSRAIQRLRHRLSEVPYETK